MAEEQTQVPLPRPKFWRDIWRIINGGKTSTGRAKDGSRIVNDGRHFKPLSLSRQKEINDIIQDYQYQNAKLVLGTSLRSLDAVREESGRLVPRIFNDYKSNVPLLQRALDSMAGRYGGPGGSTPGGVMNLNSGAGVYGQDPSLANRVIPNVWITPMEAAAIFSQKGIPETIIRKKSQSILLNGVKIRNPRLHSEQIDRVNENMIKTGLGPAMSEAIGQSLTYGGALIYPMFKRDTPLSMSLPLSTLAKYGILGKDCLDYWVKLDRWNVTNVPNWDPTAKDYLDPASYFVAFTGADVNGARASRIVTAAQPGYWGNLMTLGWGISDIPGWIQNFFDYRNVLKSVPDMINQMSMLIRTFNVEGPLSTEGSLIMDMIDENETMRVRQASVNNPISMDVVGQIEAIKRDFQQVPELVRLIRQDFAGNANIPEELLWSSERGAFASGDSTDSAYEKQSEGTRYIHIDVAHQAKKMAQIQLINALGLGRDVMAALPYTTMEFDNPRVTNAMDKAKIGGLITKGIFDMVAAGVPVDSAVEIGEQFADDEFHVSSETMEQLRAHQATKDARDTEKHEKEMELMQKQIDAPDAAPGVPGASPKPKAKPAAGEKGKGHSYADPLKQREHEVIGSKGKQGLAKAAGKQK